VGIPSIKPESRVTCCVTRGERIEWISRHTPWKVEVRYLGTGVLTDWVQVGPNFRVKAAALAWVESLEKAGIKKQPR